MGRISADEERTRQDVRDILAACRKKPRGEQLREMYLQVAEREYNGLPRHFASILERRVKEWLETLDAMRR